MAHSSEISRRDSTLQQLGGGLGVAAIVLEILIALGSCAGFGAALYLAPLPLLMGTIGLVLSLFAGWIDPHAEGSQIVAGMFTNVIAIVCGLLAVSVMSVYRPWQ